MTVPGAQSPGSAGPRPDHGPAGAAPPGDAFAPAPGDDPRARGERSEEPSPSSSRWRRPALTRDQRRTDAALAVFLFLDALLVMALMRVTQLYPEQASPLTSVLLLACLTIPLAWRRSRPIPTLVIIALAFIVAGELVVPETVVTNIALFMALYSVGAWVADRRRAAVVRAMTVAVMFVWLLVSFFRLAMDPTEGSEVEIGPGSLSPMAAFMLVQILINVLYFAGAIWFGEHAWSAARDRSRVEERARQLQAERALVEAQAITIERIRLARELHDAVAHHVSLIGVQTAAGRTLLRTDPDRASAALERAEESSREAITELHGLLGTLREEPETGTDPLGSLGIERLPELVDDARRGGLKVAHTVIGDPVQLGPLVSLNLYRIAQEALTNVRKHAGPSARVDLRLRYLDEAVELEIADDGSGRHRPRARPSPGGLGLAGMRERVGAHGGSLHTGPRRQGGYLVRARVPLIPDAALADTAAQPDASATMGADDG